jgi:hypothetical protein
MTAYHTPDMKVLLNKTRVNWMQETLCITSFGPDGYELYGKQFLQTYIKNVTLPLVVYIEGPENTPNFEHPLITYRDLLSVNGVAQALSITNFPAARGQVWGKKESNYKFNVNKFCRKSFAQIDAAGSHGQQGGKSLYWLDADIVFTERFEPPALEQFFMLYLGRPEWHSCTSFIGWNLGYAGAARFFEEYWKLYITGTIFCLPEWHDCAALDFLRQETKVAAKNLAEGMPLKGPANVFDEVFKTAHHKKGNLKFID